jgi:hypothetical protein
MRLSSVAALQSDREQFIYNWKLEDDPGLDKGDWKEAKRKRGKTANPGSYVRLRSARRLRYKNGHFMQTKVVMWIHANYPGSHAESRFSRKETQEKRALLCKPNRDEDSRKLFLAVMPNQGLAERRHRRNGHCYANWMDIHGQPTLVLVRYSSGEWEEKGNCEETDKEQKTDIDSIDRPGFIKLTRPGTSHLRPRRAVGHLIRPPPPRHFAPPPPTGIWRSNLAPSCSHSWDLERRRLHSACSSHASDTCGNRQRQRQGNLR